jgi:hypothetical protein
LMNIETITPSMLAAILSMTDTGSHRRPVSRQSGLTKLEGAQKIATRKARRTSRL